MLLTMKTTKPKNDFKLRSNELKPRERIEAAGTASVASATELLAIILKTGTAGCDVMELSSRIINAFGSVEELVKCDYNTLKSEIQRYNKLNPTRKILGIGRVKMLELAAAFELARRGYVIKKDPKAPITSAEEAAQLFRKKVGMNASQEIFWVLPLDARRRPLADPISVALGTVNGVRVHPRDVFSLAVRWNAHSIVVAHNHPSGCASPSKADKELTWGLFAAGELMGIPLLDHVIFTDKSYYSFAENNALRLN